MEPSEPYPERPRPKTGPHKSFPPPPTSAGILSLTSAHRALALHTSWLGELTSSPKSDTIIGQNSGGGFFLQADHCLWFLLGSSSSLGSPEIIGCFFPSHYSSADTWGQCSCSSLPRITWLPSKIPLTTCLPKPSSSIMISIHTYICDDNDDDDGWHTFSAYCVLGSGLGAVYA